MKASQFVDHMKLLHKPGVLTYLANRGLSLDAVRQYKLGWNDRDIFLPRENWGLVKQVKQDGSLKKLWFPQGLVIPAIESKDVVRLKIRRQFRKGDKLPRYVAVSGSMNGLTILGSSKQSAMIVWQRLYSHAQPYPTPIGNDIGEAIQKGFKIRKWIRAAIDS
jgi:DNA primase